MECPCDGELLSYLELLESLYLFVFLVRLGCSSRRYGAPAPNRVGNGVRTRPHEPFEDRRVRSVSATRPGRSHALPRARGRTHAPARAKEKRPRAAAAQRSAHACPHARKVAHTPARASHAPASSTRAITIARDWPTRGHAREEGSHVQGSVHAPGGCQLCATSALTSHIKLEEMYQAKTSRNKALLMRRLVNLKLQRETTVAEHTSLIASEFLARELGDIGGFSLSNSAPNGKLTTSMVMDALFNEEARRREMGSTDQSESQALVSERSRERGRGQGRGHHRGTGKGRWRSQARGRTVRCFYCDQEGHIKRDCPKYKAQEQSLDTATTTVMAVDEDETCEGRIWMANNTASRVVGRGTVQFYMADGRSVTLTEVRYVPNLRKNLISIGMLDSKGCSFEASGGILRVSKGNKEMLWGKKTRGLYRLEGNVQTGGATVRHGSSGISEKSGQGKQPLHRGTQSKRRGTWRIRSGTRAQGDALGYVRKSGQTRVVQPVQDVHREKLRGRRPSRFEKLYSEGRSDAEASPFCSRFDQWRCSLQLCAQGRRDGATTTRKVTYFAAHPRWGVQGPSSYGGAGSEVVRKDNLKTSDYPPVGWRGRLFESSPSG
ncbi:hypothetical protein Acr_13g0009190 [Actinidia rufa]|uniref:CCHC-type domain-containing protein n=1 Tax=Actinidia rufa TaxID=165716 RepID=A0A7J0FN09_9ERIC|nr:hypothetical protein Acr_13g0009190 [Actinidia rufa]